MRRSLIPFIALLSLCVSTTRAQWQTVGPVITHSTYGAIHYKSGDLWVGGLELFRTTDLGVSWEKIVFPDQSGITDICFLNRDTGIVSTLTDIYQTFDRGTNWTGIARDKYQYMRASYVFSQQNIFGMAGGNLYISRDGGKSWT